MKELETKEKDKLERVKQQVIEIQKVFDHSITPHKGHTLFEVNLLTNTIEEAVFDKQPEISWADAVKGNYGVRREVTKKEGCVYISSLNEKNVRKLLKREYNITS